MKKKTAGCIGLNRADSSSSSTSQIHISPSIHPTSTQIKETESQILVQIKNPITPIARTRRTNKKMKSIRTLPGGDGRCLDPATSERRWERGRAMPDPAAPEHRWEAKRIERTRCCAGSDRFRAPAGGR